MFCGRQEGRAPVSDCVVSPVKYFRNPAIILLFVPFTELQVVVLSTGAFSLLWFNLVEVWLNFISVHFNLVFISTGADSLESVYIYTHTHTDIVWWHAGGI